MVAPDRLHAVTAAFTILFVCSVATETAVAQDGSRSLPELEWDMTLKNVAFDNDKFIGQRYTAKCPPQSVRDMYKGIHGTDTYPSRSAICVAAVHAGAVGAEGGIVTVQLNPGLSEYVGSTRNGIESASLPATDRSIVFFSTENAGTPDEVRSAYIPRIKWDTKFTSTTFARKQYTGQRFAFECPAAPGDLQPKYIFGTDTYAFRSVICVAAVHAGKITTAGGVVYVQIDPEADELVGSTRNGIESRDDQAPQHHTISFTDSQP